MKDSVIILSGGMDSTTLLYEMQERIALAVSFDYGSNHNAREIGYAKLHCRRLGIRHALIRLDFMHDYFKSSLLDGADAVPEGHYAPAIGAPPFFSTTMPLTVSANAGKPAVDIITKTIKINRRILNLNCDGKNMMLLLQPIYKKVKLILQGGLRFHPPYFLPVFGW